MFRPMLRAATFPSGDFQDERREIQNKYVGGTLQELVAGNSAASPDAHPSRELWKIVRRVYARARARARGGN